MPDAYVVSATRTPIGRFGGSLKDFSPTDLGAHVMRSALDRADVKGDDLDLYIFGNVLRSGHGQLVPRQAAVQAGIPQSVDGYAIDMVCSSAMMTVMNAATSIKAGESDMVLTGGVESMSQAGFHLSYKARWGYKFIMGPTEPLVDTMFHDGLTDPIENDGMGSETDRLAEEYEVTRQELDAVAYESHRRAGEATTSGFFKNEIEPLEIRTRRETRILETDEGIRADTTQEALAGLRPAFSREGLLTAGNSSQISDGAAALLIASEAAVEKHNLKPIARILGGAVAAGDSWRFVEAPVPAVQKLLGRLGKTIDEFDLVENNEAFALNSVLFHKVLGVPYEKMNIHGGAIALGHPIGCTGARIIVTLLNGLEATGGKLGLAALCHGTGGGTAMALERV